MPWRAISTMKPSGNTYSDGMTSDMHRSLSAGIHAHIEERAAADSSRTRAALMGGFGLDVAS